MRINPSINDKDSIISIIKNNIIIDPDTKCWLWIKGKNKGGYGKLKLRGKPYLVHRLSLYVFTENFDIDDDNIKSLHVTWCPNTSCINPEHLYSGTQADNVHDTAFKVRITSEYPCGHLRTTENTTLSNCCKYCHNKDSRDIMRLKRSGVNKNG